MSQSNIASEILRGATQNRLSSENPSRVSKAAPTAAASEFQNEPPAESTKEIDPDHKDCDCTPPCECETPTESTRAPSPTKGASPTNLTADGMLAEENAAGALEVTTRSYQLDEFKRAKAYLLQASSKSGLNLYDHLSEVIRKILDDRGPDNAVDYIEEISMNVKRYRFGMVKDGLKDRMEMSEVMIKDAKLIADIWKDNIDLRNGEYGGGDMSGKYPNLLKLQNYMDQINIGFSREEMFRISLAVKELIDCNPEIKNPRFWGKVVCSYSNYYVVEADNAVGTEWQANETDAGTGDTTTVAEEAQQYEEKIMKSDETFQRAGSVVFDQQFLAAYSQTSGKDDQQDKELPGEDSKSQKQFTSTYDRAQWETYLQEVMSNFPVPENPENLQPEEPPIEPDGTGVNKKSFYVCSELGEDWIRLPSISPQHVNSSRIIRWLLTGKLDGKIRTLPEFPGQEGHYLRALLARINCGAVVSPKGYYKGAGRYLDEYDGEDDEEEYDSEEEETIAKPDAELQPVKRYLPQMKLLVDPSMKYWVHHTPYILKIGRVLPWKPQNAIQMGPGPASVRGESEESDTEYEGEGADGDEFRPQQPKKEPAPPLLAPVGGDVSFDEKPSWTLMTSATIFPDFQVAALRSNNWPGSYAFCSIRGDVGNIYVGDGMKFRDRCYSPTIPVEGVSEWKVGPELQERLDPTVEEEAAWLEKVELQQIADIEDKFVDNEDEEETSYEEDETEEDDLEDEEVEESDF